LDFLDFRHHLFPASGFQSYQFRMIENLLGLQEDERMTYDGCPYYSVFDEQKQEKLKEITQSASLFDAMENWLERTPFLQTGSFQFLKAYQQAVDRMLEKEQAAIKASNYLTEDEKGMRLKMLGHTDKYFDAVLSKDYHEELQAKGSLRMSHKATMAALFINLYRDEPLLYPPFQLLTCFIEIDEGLTAWRYRHSQMVLRMLGNKIGTGGSSGHKYLHETADKHHIFNDLHNISTLLIPRSELPELPTELKKALAFHYTQQQTGSV